jgi:hypothetical protein
MSISIFLSVFMDNTCVHEHDHIQVFSICYFLRHVCQCTVCPCPWLSPYPCPYPFSCPCPCLCPCCVFFNFFFVHDHARAHAHYYAHVHVHVLVAWIWHVNRTTFWVKPAIFHINRVADLLFPIGWFNPVRLEDERLDNVNMDVNLNMDMDKDIDMGTRTDMEIDTDVWHGPEHGHLG